MTDEQLDDVALNHLADYDRKKAREREFFVRALQREVERRDRLRERLSSSTHWRTAESEVLEIAKMSSRHAANCVAMFERDAWALWHLFGSPGESPRAWVEEQPVYRALQQRSSQRDGPILAIRDRRAVRRWRKLHPNARPRSLVRAPSECDEVF